MRVLLSTWGSRGDVEPLAGLAVALRGLGAEASVAAPPDDDFVELLGRAGVPLVPLGPSVKSVVSGEKPPTAKDAFWLAPELVRARFEVLGKAAEGCDLMMGSGLMPAGVRDVAEHLGIPYVYACFQIFGLPSRHFRPGQRPGTPSSEDETDSEVLWKQDAERVNGLYGEALNAGRAKLGMPPVDNVRDHVFTDRPLLAADPTLCPSEGMTNYDDLVQTGAWLLPDERPLPDDLTAFLDAGAPPVYVGFGSMAAHAPSDIARVATESIRAQGHRVLLGSGWAGLGLVDDADDCFAIGEVNQQALFRRVAAVVHHGGAGTTTTAAGAGAPQVIMPRIADQPYWASRVADLGIGVAHMDSTATVESLTAALTQVLTPETRARASEVAGMIRTDGATVAAKMLLER
ncbi:vancomycin aglycone glucosyltransferase [Amycolatopsis xylanica]|uniref:Vancomycin aglycone glucosyltransferase n=1 Tax=Amycolatopsis xylanica TaxID=589385 RepID=A0A1H3QTS7_9PSEU|nr:glycosyltransferase [Amycolatopsis xylanica]SDZ16415.1 vancomycin aglycone glucosyltransferase [Amycolatopsis xylanica]